MLHTWSCFIKDTGTDVWKAQFSRVISAFWLGRAIGGSAVEGMVPVNFVTRGLMNTDSLPPIPENHGLASGSAALQEEYPNLAIRTIDLVDSDLNPSTLERLKPLFFSSAHHPRLALRDNRWWLPAFEAQPPVFLDREPGRVRMKSGGVYLVVGKLKDAVGSLVVSLCETCEGATVVILNQQRVAGDESSGEFDATDRHQRDWIARMEEGGAHVQRLEVDPEDGDSLEKSFDAVKRQHRRIDGIIQVDGKKREGPVSRMSLSGIELTFRGAAMPARIIHEYLLRRRIFPDFVIYASSTAADLVPANQGDHVAVSGYRNGLAELGQVKGLPAISVSWLEEGSGTSPLPMPASTRGSTLVISSQPYESRVGESIDRRQPGSSLLESLDRDMGESTEERMLNLWRKELDDPGLGANDDYFECGGDSMLAVRLLGEIRKEFGVSVPVSGLASHPTVTSLIGFMGLSDSGKDRGDSVASEAKTDHIIPLVHLPAKGKAPLYCFHAEEGGVMCYRSLASRLPDHRAVYGVESRRLHHDDRDGIADIETLAREHWEAIRTHQPEGPYAFAGYSFGALLAYSVAQMAESEGADVEGLILYDMVNTAAVSPLPLIDRLKWIWEVRSELPPLQRLGSTVARLGELGWWMCHHASVFMKLKTGRFSEPFSRRVRVRFEHEKLVGTFQPRGFRGRALLILTEDPGDKYRTGERCGWEDAIQGTLTCRLVSGNHLEIFSHPHLDRLVWHTDEFLNPDSARKIPKSMVSDKVVSVGSDEIPDWGDQLAKFPKTGE